MRRVSPKLLACSKKRRSSLLKDSCGQYAYTVLMLNFLQEKVKVKFILFLVFIGLLDLGVGF